MCDRVVSEDSCFIVYCPNKYKTLIKWLFLTLFRMGGKKPSLPPTIFSPVTFTKVGVSSQNFQTFGLALFPH